MRPPAEGQGVGVEVVVVEVQVGPQEQADRYLSGAVPQKAVALVG